MLQELLISCTTGISCAFVVIWFVKTKFKVPQQSIVYKHVPHIVSDAGNRICTSCGNQVAKYTEDGDKVICANCQVGGK